MPQILTPFTKSNSLPIGNALNRIVHALNSLSDRTDPLSPTSGAMVLQRAAVTLTHAQILALPTTPVRIVPAAPAGYFNSLVAYSFSVDTVAGDYTNIDSSYASLELRVPEDEWMGVPLIRDTANGTDRVGRLLASGFGANAKIVMFGPAYTELQGGGWIQSGGGTRGQLEAAPIELAMDNNGSGNLTGGDPANTLRVGVTYFVEPL